MEIIKITAAVDEMSPQNRRRERPRDFAGRLRAGATFSLRCAVAALDDFDREVCKVQLFAAGDRRQPLLVDSGGEDDVRRGPGADDLRSEALGDKRNIADMIRVAVPRADVIRSVDVLQHRCFVGLPLAVARFGFAREERIDEDHGLAGADLPARDAEPLEHNFVLSIGGRRNAAKYNYDKTKDRISHYGSPVS